MYLYIQWSKPDEIKYLMPNVQYVYELHKNKYIFNIIFAHNFGNL